MTVDAPSEVIVRYDGGAVGTEIWGMTQANFLVRLPGANAKDVAVMLNDAAARVLAKALEQEDTPEFRRAAVEHAGAYLVEKLANSGRYFSSALNLSEGVLDENPDILEHLKRTRV